MPIVPAVKNPYFTYFKVVSDDGNTQSFAVRSKEQFWTGLGITMQIQGTMPGGSKHWGKGTYNCFGKKHLVSTDGEVGSADRKMAKIVGKRDISGAASAHSARGEKLAMLKQISLDGLDGPEKGKAIGSFKKEIGKEYEQFAYGATRTDVCTFVVLDGLDPQTVKDCFATPIAAVVGGWADDEKKTITVTFATTCVVTHHLNGSQTTKNTMSVDVVRKSNSGADIYYVYHCNG